VRMSLKKQEEDENGRIILINKIRAGSRCSISIVTKQFQYLNSYPLDCGEPVHIVLFC
jgi:hypothetical protein